jgi:hypothetical protein
MKVIAVLFTVLCLSFGAKAQAINKESLAGEWISVDDINYSLVFDIDVIKEYYNGKITETYNYEVLVTPCDTAYLTKPLKGVTFLHKYNIEDSLCYEITGLSPTHLTLIYTVTGNILSFKRKKD